MGVGGRPDVGLWITTRDVIWDYNNRDLTRFSEVGVIHVFGLNTVNAQIYRTDGLHIGMQYRTAHKVGPDAAHDGQIDFAVAQKGADYTQAGWVWTPVAQDTGANSVTKRLGEVFSSPGGTVWRGYVLTAQMINTYPRPPVGQEADERLYFRIVIRNYQPHHVGSGPYSVNDVHIVPMVCIRIGEDFATHYALGVGAFTVGHRFTAMQFDSQVIAHDMPNTVQPLAPPAPPRNKPKPKKPKAVRARSRRRRGR